ncbi:MAG: hypothetical protein AB1445_00545 [Bacillota bacterium]
MNLAHQPDPSRSQMIRRGLPRWCAVAMALGLYVACYMLSIWSGTHVFAFFGLLGVIAALVVTITHAGELQRRDYWISAALGAVVLIAAIPGHPSAAADGVVCAVLTALPLLAGIALWRRNRLGARSRLADGGPVTALMRSLLLGIAVAVPWVAYTVARSVYLGHTRIQLVPSLGAALVMLRPGIMEEALFRFFWPNLLLALARPGSGATGGRMWTRFVFVLFAILHGFAHPGPALLVDPWSAIPRVMAWSLFYGLPLVWLALRRDVEAAMACHWLLNFGPMALGVV